MKITTKDKFPYFGIKTETVGINYEMSGYWRLRLEEWDTDVRFNIDGKKIEMTFEEFEKALGL